MRILATIGTLLSFGALAQNSDGIISATLDRDSILIGEQVVLTLEVDPDGLPVTWPVIGDTLAPHIEVVGDSGLDTLQTDASGGPTGVRVVRQLLLTSFDTGYWAVPSLRFRIGMQDLESKAFLVHVQGVELDSAATPKDIKPIHELPFSMLWWLRENWIWGAGGGAIALAVIALILLVRRARRKAPAAEVEAPPVPLHERVLMQLEALDKERVWQQGDHKGYQSRLTDLLRGYIEERYRVPALERTTDELLHELRVSPLSMEQQSLIGNLLRLADMVKFAKALPSPQENEQMMVSAVRFIHETVPTNQADAPRT